MLNNIKTLSWHAVQKVHTIFLLSDMAQLSIDDVYNKTKIVEEYAKVKADQDKAILLILQWLTLKTWRDASSSQVKDVLKHYPFLKEAVFFVSFQMAMLNIYTHIKILDITDIFPFIRHDHY